MDPQAPATPDVVETPSAPIEEPSSVEIPAVDTPASGSEAVTTTTEDNQQFVPYSRFKEVNDELKEIKQKVDGITAPKEPAIEAEPVQLDPEVASMLDQYMASKGVVLKSEIEAERAAEQAQRDLADIKTQFKLSDADLEAVRTEAVAAGATNRKGLENAYYRLNMDKIVEAKVKEALAQGGAPTVTEKPGPGTGPTKPEGEQRAGMSIKERIAAARGQ